MKSNLNSIEETVDGDVCSKAQLKHIFNKNYSISCEKAISLKKNYILQLSASHDFKKIATGSTDQSVQLFQITESSFVNILSSDNNFGNHDANICGIKFMNDDDNLLFSGSTNGKINLTDLRSFETIHSFEDATGESIKSITTFDVNPNNRILCAGTDQINSDVFLIFYDIRERSLLGGYWESHQDDVTQIKFHPSNSNLLASGSTDGLINIFDISETSEDDALQQCFNTASSVDLINWHTNVYEQDFLSCITHTNDLLIYDVDSSEKVAEFNRQSIYEVAKRKSANYCNLINCHNGINNEVMVLVGSQFNLGEALRCLKFENKTLIPEVNFEGNKQIIRTSLYNPKDDSFITGGENGAITLWKLQTEENEKLDLNRSLKETCKISNKLHNKKPY